ncbi:hypothetical protein FRC11_015063 [Ceratobasidium sp. 423]|nr:hypothetical protein FRC11_015063 [Ceratobasidium sp. 423]
METPQQPSGSNKKARTSSSQVTPLGSPDVPPNTLPIDSEPSSQVSPIKVLNTLPGGQVDVQATATEQRAEHIRVRNRARNDRIQEVNRACSLLQFAWDEYDEDTVSGWSEEEILAKAQALEGEILESSDGRCICIYEDIEPDLSEEKIKLECWTILNHGTIYGYHMINGNKMLVFAARFCPYDKMNPKELEEIKFLAKHFWKLGNLFHPVESNAAKTGGIMFAEGWRFGYEALFSLGLYVMNRRGEANPQEYADFLEEMEEASAIYVQRYKTLAPYQYLVCSLGFMEESCVPHFGTTKPETQNVTSFGSNLTVTWGDF